MLELYEKPLITQTREIRYTDESNGTEKIGISKIIKKNSIHTPPEHKICLQC